MKRAALVHYVSSDEEGEQHVSRIDEPVAHPPKKRKLPSLSSHLLPQLPVDNPALHQGRRRTTSHVQGQFAAYVYVPVILPTQSRLFKLLLRIFDAAKQDAPTIHSIGLPTDGPSSSAHDTDHGRTVELHVSLTRPTYLRAHQRDEFKRAVRKAASSKARFAASFATIAELTNDERTRTFLTLEVGAGHDDFRSLSDRLTPMLRSLRQKEFYGEPRFHVSFAWALLDGAHLSRNGPTQTEPGRSPVGTAGTSSPTLKPGDEAVQAACSDAIFSTIPCFPESLVPRLQDQFGRELTLPGVGGFEAEEVHVRIGKDVSQFTLSGSEA